MADKPQIPAWQRVQTDQPSTPSPVQEPPQQPEPNAVAALGAGESTDTGREEQEAQSDPLLEQASSFLQDPAIRDAPREKKAAFLESKGVRAEDIDRLLDTSIAEDAAPDITEAGERAWSTAPPKPATATSPTPRPPTHDIPPIVTYPEFLTQSTQPPPLITTRRLLNTAYITGGLAATIYGLSKYLVAPMTQTLAESRHDFASHAREQLDELNKRLRDAASEDPANKLKPKVTDIVDDISEADSDPTELFHRDFGTQTTPSLSRRPSASSDPDEQPTVTSHENRLKILTSHLRELEATRSNDTASSDSLKTKLSDLTTYLSEMSYQSQYYSGMGGFYGGNYGLPKGRDGKDDQIEVLKNDIRAVKGVFLSARNFPASGRSVTPVGRAGG